MAGKNQHHLWQMLQRGFAAQEGRQHYTFAYGKSGIPERKNTKKFGSEEFFYGPEGSAADENITTFELKMERHIQTLRREKDGYQADSHIMAAFVSHLEMRSFFLRSELIRLSDEMMASLQRHLTSRSKMQRLLTNYLTNHPEILRNMTDKLSLPPEEGALAASYANNILPSLIEKAAPEQAKVASVVFSALAPEMINAAKDAHIKALENDFFAVGRADTHKGWTFLVKRYDGGGLVLPDTALAFIGKEKCAPFSDKRSQFSEVVVPLSDRVAVIGTSKKSIHRTSDALNRILASCSYQGFAARQDVGSLRKLTRRIGKNAELVSTSELRRAFSFENLLDRL